VDKPRIGFVQIKFLHNLPDGYAGLQKKVYVEPWSSISKCILRPCPSGGPWVQDPPFKLSKDACHSPHPSNVRLLAASKVQN